MSDRLNTTFAALADPTRRAILGRLARGETSVTELAEPFDMSLPAISKHLKAEPLQEVADWVEQYRRYWEESFDRLDDYLQELQTKGKSHGRKKKRSR